MNRRDFMKSIGMTALGLIAVPLLKRETKIKFAQSTPAWDQCVDFEERNISNFYGGTYSRIWVRDYDGTKR
jgi:hypothetical protein